MRRFYLTAKRKKQAIIAGCVLAAASLYGFSSLFKGTGEARLQLMTEDSREIRSEASEEESEDGREESEAVLAVHVSGAVKNPEKVYYLPAGARIADAVKAAGGAAETANLAAVNLAAAVRDGQKIRIPFQGEETEENSEGGEETKEFAESLLTNINLASKIELQELPGIGEVIAQRIIDYRELCGRFLDPEQLLEVDGIGQAKYEKIRDLVTVRNTE